MAKMTMHGAQRIIARLKRYQQESPEMQRALYAIGNLVANQAKRNLTSSGAIDSGILRAAMAFRIEKAAGISRVVVGAFGIKYARMVEFGGVMTKRQMAAMFASFRERGKKRKPGKGIIANMHYRKRPYLAPALKEMRPSIVAELAKVRGD